MFIISLIQNFAIALLSVPFIWMKMLDQEKEREDDMNTTEVSQVPGDSENETELSFDYNTSIDMDSSSGYESDDCSFELIKTAGVEPRPILIRRGTVKKNMKIFETYG